MGILLLFLLICLILYAVLVTKIVYLILKWLLVTVLGMSLNLKLLWIISNLSLWLIALLTIWKMLQDSKGSTPNMDPVWKFYLIMNTILFLLVFLLGYKSK